MPRKKNKNQKLSWAPIFERFLESLLKTLKMAKHFCFFNFLQVLRKKNIHKKPKIKSESVESDKTVKMRKFLLEFFC